MKRKRAFGLVIAFLLLVSLTTTGLAAFTDTATNPYKDEIDYCQTKGYVTGFSATSFVPDANVTRGQFSVAWCRFMGFRTTHNFTDIALLAPKNYYDIASFILYSTGVINGTSTSTFSPDSSLTREQLAVITARGERLSATDPNAYKGYKDADSISSWATDGVSACLGHGLFKGLFAGENFEPTKAVTRAELCKLLYNIDKPQHTITVAALSGGTVTPSKTAAYAGDPITLTITPDKDKQLKAGSLKYNDTVISGESFTMPARDVIITAVFEDIPVSPSPSESPSPSPSESPSPSPSESPSPSPSESPSPSPSESPSPSPSESPSPSPSAT